MEAALVFSQKMVSVGYEVRPGPGQLLRWGVDDARLHDDLMLSRGLVEELDAVD